MSSRRFRDLPGTPSTIDRQNLLLRLSNQSGSTAYQFRETKLLFRSKVERLPGEFRSNKIRNTRWTRCSVEIRTQLASLCGLSLIGAIQRRLGHFQNLPRTQRGRALFRLVLRNPDVAAGDFGFTLNRRGTHRTL